MSRIRSRHSMPEVLVRSMLHRLGFRFRMNVPGLPGKPDIVLPKYKTVIFVHGCFWHMHKGCKKASIPSSNHLYWKNKLERNKKRDRENIREVHKLGWRSCVVWECEIVEDPLKVANKISRFLLGKNLSYALPEKRQLMRIAEKRRKYLKGGKNPKGNANDSV